MGRLCHRSLHGHVYEECGALLHFYEEGLHGYTYLEDVHER